MVWGATSSVKRGLKYLTLVDIPERPLTKWECAWRRERTAPVPFLNPNALLPHLDNLTAERSCGFPFRFEVIRNLVRALVSQIEISFRDQEEVEKSLQRTFQTRRFPSLAVHFVVIATVLNLHAVWRSVYRERQVTVI